jgi:hypothetical protein
MEETLNIIPEKPYLVFIALNPTEEAIKNKSVFSRDESFWNLLINAGIIKKTIKELDLKQRAKAIFLQQLHIHSQFPLGFADLLPLINEKDSNKVKVPGNAAEELFRSSPNLKHTKKIALLGQKVVDSFAKEFDLTKWNEILISDDGKKQFGLIGEITIENNNIKVYAMPFPVNSSIANKHEFYRKLFNQEN